MAKTHMRKAKQKKDPQTIPDFNLVRVLDRDLQK